MPEAEKTIYYTIKRAFKYLSKIHSRGWKSIIEKGYINLNIYKSKVFF